MESSPKRIVVYIPILLSIAFILGLIVAKYLPKNENSSTVPTSYDKLSSILTYIQEEYVDSVSRDELTELTIPSLLENLDPHSIYIPASELTAINEPLEGEFEGIGIEFNIQNDTIIVVNTISGGPSEKKGIMPGDRIVKINDTLVAGTSITNAEVMKKLKGKRGTIVDLKIVRKNTAKLLNFEITRDKIPLYSVDASFMINPGIGYIKVSKFAKNTANEFHSALKKLKDKGMKKVIVDLRSNSGGYLDAATNMADEFLSDGQLIVYTLGRSRPKYTIDATTKGIAENTPIVVLIDEWSASASEIFAGAIQDNDRGTIVGRRSFGKGLVQEPVYFDDGSSLRLTVARYYTPTGRCIQKPYDGKSNDYYYDIINRYEHGEFQVKDSIHFPDSLKYITPKGKVVYGGGGIMPDLFVPVDTSSVTPFLTEVINEGLIYQFAWNYSDKNRGMLSKYNDWESIHKFLDKANLINTFIEYAKQKGITAEVKDLQKSEKLLGNHLQAYIARNIIGDDGFYPIALQNDQTIQKAIVSFSR